MHQKLFPIPLCGSALSLLVGLSLPTHAVIWDNGAANGLWSTGANWDTNLEPAAASAVELPVGLARTITLSAGEVGNTLSFQASGYTLSGGSLTLTNGGITVNPTFSGTITTTLNGTVIDKLGTGTLVLSGTNGFTGATTVSAGVLNIQSNLGLGSNVGGTSVLAGAALQLQGGVTITGEALSLRSSGISVTGSLRNISGDNQFNGTITLASNSRINSDSGTLTINPSGNSLEAVNRPITFGGAGNIVVSKAIATGTTNKSKINKDGAGTLTLLGTNTYRGVTNVNAGVLNIQNSSALGTTTRGTTVKVGGELQLQGGIAVGTEALTLNSTGITNTGALRSISGLNSFAGVITLGSAARINTDLSTLTLSGGILGTGFSLTVGGAGDTVINTTGINTGAGGALIKDGTGMLTVGAAGNYTGMTTINAGVLRIGNADALGGAANAKVAFGAGVASGTKLQLNNNSLTLVELSSNATPGLPTVENGTAGTATLTINNATANTYAGALNNGAAGTLALIKGAAGTLTLSGASNFSGTTTVSSGVLNIQNATALGTTAAGTIVNSGGALELQGGISVGAEGLILNGTGVGAAGALRSVSGANTYGGAIVLGATGVRINSDSAGTALTLNNAAGITGTGFNLTVGGAGDTVIGTLVTANGLQTGAAATLTKDGTGKLTLLGSGNYTGLTTVSAGVLNVQNATALGTTAAGTTVSGGAALELQGGIVVAAEGLTLNGTGVGAAGALRSVNGANTFGGAIVLGSTGVRINSDNAGDALTLNNTAGITGTGFNLTVGGAGDTVLGTLATANGLRTGAAATLTKDGTGKLTLLGSGNYTGLTTVSAGVLNIQNTTALGTTAAGTVVSNGGALELQGGIAVSAGEALSLIGSGVSNGGALRNVSGANSYSETITLTGNARINSDAGTLTLNGAGSAVTGAFNLTLGGTGNTAVNTPVATGSLTKDGAGIVTLSAANTYTGVTTLDAGTLRLNYGANSSMLSDSAALILNSGILDLAGTVAHNEIVASTSLTGSVYITRSSGSSTINLNTISVVGGEATLDISEDGIAMTDNLNDITGLLGSWITVNGQFATNLTNTADGVIVAYTGYMDVPRLGGIIAGGANNIRITDAGNTSGNITLPAAGTTTINTILQAASGGTATVDIGVSKTLRISSGGILLSDGNGALVFGNNGTLTAGTADDTAATLFLNNQSTVNSMTVNAAIADNGTGEVSVSKSGTGNLILGGTNTYTGLTTISEGTLALGASNVFGSGDITINGATAVLALGLNQSDTVGTVTLEGGGSITGSGTSTLSSTDGFEMKSGSVSAILGGSGGLNKTTAGVVTLSGANTYTGPTTVSEGTLAYGASNVIAGGVAVDGSTAVLALGTNQSDTVGTVTLDGGGSITGSGTSTLTSTGSFEMKSGSVSAILGGGGTGLNKTTTGTVTLNGANTYSGLTTVSAGTLAYGASNVIGTGDVTINGATAVLALGTNQSDTVGTVTLDGGGSITGSGTSTLTSTSGFEMKSGSVGAILSGSGIGLNKTTTGTVMLNRVNSYTGATTITDGILRAGVATQAFGINSAVTLANNATATLDLNNFSQTIGSLAGGGVTGGNVTLGSATLTTGGASNTTYAGILSGTGGVLNKIGSGTFTLSGANNYTGTTTVTAGALNIQHNTALGTGAAGTSVNSGTELQLQNNITVTGEALTINGSGITTSGSLRNISGNNTWTGGITLGSIATIGSDAGNMTLSGVINGGAGISLTKTGTGTVVFSGINTYLGTTTINAGTLNIQNSSALGNTAGATTVTNGAALELQGGITVAGELLTLDGNGVANGGALRNISGSNIYNATITLSGDSMVASDSGTLTLTSSGDAFTGAFDLTLGGAGSIIVSKDIAIDTGSLTKEGAGSVMLMASNSYDGETIVSEGTLTYGVNNAIDNGSEVTVNGATAVLSLGAFNDTVASVAVDGGGSITGSGLLTVSASSFEMMNGSVSARLGGTAPLNKTTSGTVVLSGTNTYTGPTTISEGSLIVNGSISGSSLTTINSDGTLGGDGTVGALALNGGILSPGNTIGTLDAGATTFTSGTFAIDLTGTVAGVSYDQLNITGLFTLSSLITLSIDLGGFNPLDNGSQTFTIVSNDGGDAIAGAGRFANGATPLNEGDIFLTSGQAFRISYLGGDVMLTAVPEPAVTSMLLLGFVGIAGYRRRRAV